MLRYLRSSSVRQAAAQVVNLTPVRTSLRNSSLLSFHHVSHKYKTISELPLQSIANVPKKCSLSLSLRRFASGPDVNISNPELYTETAYSGISKLPNYANTYKTQYVEVPHMLKSFYDEGSDGLMQTILTKCGISLDTFHK